MRGWRFASWFHKAAGKTSDSSSKQDSRGLGNVLSFLDSGAPDVHERGSRKSHSVTLLPNLLLLLEILGTSIHHLSTLMTDTMPGKKDAGSTKGWDEGVGRSMLPEA